MAFTYTRSIHFADTDAAGVVYFARILSLCHEAYEEALEQAGIPLRDMLASQTVVVPISRSEADFLRPLALGDTVRITATPEPIDDNSFAVVYEAYRGGWPEKLAARVRTEHVCISREKRERAPLPPKLATWVKSGAPRA